MKVDDSGVVTTTSQFLQIALEVLYLNHKGKKDMRPIWLIDGQHRTRGLCLNENGYDLEIPIIFFPPGFDLSQSAKIFAEINTLQKKLSALHTLFMQHRFSIPSPTKKRDFSRNDDGSFPDEVSYMNHMSYECAAALTSNEGGPLYNRVKILDSTEKKSIIKATQWLDFSRSWWKQGNIYSADKGFSQDHMNTEVENYFKALVETCNHDGWENDPDPRNRWDPPGSTKGLIEKHGPGRHFSGYSQRLGRRPGPWGRNRQFPKSTS